MNTTPSTELKRLLHDLRSPLFPRRKAAAEQINLMSITPASFPGVPSEKSADFSVAIKEAVAQATDPALIKQSINLPRLAPGFIPLLLCFGAQVAGVLPRGGVAALLWAAATVFLGWWYFRNLLAGVQAQTNAAGRALELGREIGGPYRARG